MANVYLSNPIFFDTSTTVAAGNTGTNWKGTGNSPKASSYTGGIGIRACKIILAVGGTPAIGSVTINETTTGGTVSGPVLFQANYPSLAGIAAPEYELTETATGWHDFIVTITPAASAVVLLYYRV